MADVGASGGEDASLKSDVLGGESVPSEAGLACTDLLPLDLWVWVAAELGWPDRAFFAAACRGFAIAAGAAENRRAVRPRVEVRHWHAPGFAVRRVDWKCFVTSGSRVRAALAGTPPAGSIELAAQTSAADKGSPPDPKLAATAAPQICAKHWADRRDAPTRFAGVGYHDLLFETLEFGDRRALGALLMHGGRPPGWVRATLLARAAQRGRLDLCVYLAAVCRYERADVRAGRNKALRLAAAGGHLEVCEWLADVFALDADDLQQRDNEALGSAAALGAEDLCFWLIRRAAGPGEEDHLRIFAATAAANAGRAELCKKLVTGVRRASAWTWRLMSCAAMLGDVGLCDWLADQIEAAGLRRHGWLPNTLHNAAEGGRVAVCDWLEARFNFRCTAAQAKDCFHLAAGCGKLEACRWLAAHSGLQAADVRADNNVALRHAAGGGHLEVCEWLADTFGLTAADARARAGDSLNRSCDALTRACRSGHANTAKWLVTRFGLTADDARAGNAMYCAMISGDAELCEWLVATLGLGSEDAGGVRFPGADVEEYALIEMDRIVHLGCLDVCKWMIARFGRAHCGDPTSLLATAASGGHLALCEWLTDTYALTADDVRANADYCFRSAAEAGKLETCEWLADRFGLTIEDVRANENEALRGAVSMGIIPLCEWLASRFGLTADDARACKNEALCFSVEFGNLDVCKWLVERLGLTAEDARAAIKSIADGYANDSDDDFCRRFMGSAETVAWLKQRFGI